jgi:hypothetical protein
MPGCDGPRMSITHIIMTNEQCLIVLTAARIVLMTLLTLLVGEDAAGELLGGVVTTAAAAGIVGDLNTSQGTYDGSPDTFVDTPANIDALDDVVDAMSALEIGSVETQSGDAYDALQAASPD